MERADSDGKDRHESGNENLATAILQILDQRELIEDAHFKSANQMDFTMHRRGTTQKQHNIEANEMD